jgi:raffinose/stachyose/melibiose transport system permease protein
MNIVEKTPRKKLSAGKIGVYARYITLILWCATTVFPFAWTILSSFKNNQQIYGAPLAWPNPAVLGNFGKAWEGTNVLVTGTNSLLYSMLTVIFTLAIAAPAAFYCSKIAKNRLLHTYFVTGIMIPVHAILIPCFITLRNLQAFDSKWGIVLLYVAVNLAFSIFILSGFMNSLPNELIEASVIDGCGPIRVFLTMLPLTKAGLATAMTFVFLGVWNEMLFAMIMLPSPVNRTLNVAAINLRGQFVSDQGLLSAGLVILIVPAIIIYTLFQEQVVKGLTAGAVKG